MKILKCFYFFMMLVVIAFGGIQVIRYLYKEMGYSFLYSSLEECTIPAYPEKTASLDRLLSHFSNEVVKQGIKVNVKIINLDSNDFHIVRGIAGNGYIFLNSMRDEFGASYRCTKNGDLIVTCSPKK